MIRYEKIWGALLDPPACGRPAGHTGQCRSTLSMDRSREQERERWVEIGKRRKAKRARIAQQKVVDQLAVIVDRASDDARHRAVGRLHPEAFLADPPSLDTEDRLAD
jgi:hypothetical protein